MLAPDEAPHLIELHLGDRQVAKQVPIDLMGLLRGSPQPRQDGFFGHAQDEADVGKRDLTSSIFKAIMTFSSGVLRSKKTVSRVSEKGRAHLLQQKMRRLPLWVIYVEMALTLPRCISR